MSFFEDDTLDIVRQHIALAVNSYPTRLYVEAHVSLSADYYADPRHWEALFLRVSLNGSRVDKELFKVYLEQVRGIALVEPPFSSSSGRISLAILPLIVPPSIKPTISASCSGRRGRVV